jgi:hypothetical protein
MTAFSPFSDFAELSARYLPNGRESKSWPERLSDESAAWKAVRLNSVIVEAAASCEHPAEVSAKSTVTARMTSPYGGVYTVLL